MSLYRLVTSFPVGVNGTLIGNRFALSIDDAISGLARPLAVGWNIAYSSKTVRDRHLVSKEHE
jgi:hypothetical protein